VGALGPDPLVAEGAMTIVDGKAAVPTGPGLGLTLDEAALKRMTLSATVVEP
jgi:L-alanine-DL-glutamate epimerase-like enolase superfamily enzyme